MEQNAEILKKAIFGSLKIVEQEREKEIISRRFGLKGAKETLEQIGESLSITRERVRQLEKAILIRLQISAEDGQIPELASAEKLLVRNLTEMGRVARLDELANKIYGKPVTAAEQNGIYYIATFAKNLSVVEENDKYYYAVGIAEYGSAFEIRSRVDEVVSVISKNKQPMTLDELDSKLDYEHPDHIKAIASISKLLATLNGVWGLAKWPAVNPKNIRDKIYVILESKKEPMHFSAIADEIKNSNFKRKNVTVQAIHNELIKDPRFILIGRGIYALNTWGYKKGTISDIILSVLEKSDKPLTKEEIVKQVLKVRKVKETTILLNLQNKKLFKKVDRNSYTKAD
ncbi:MAG: sigma factor-like helix-turn-helix DNA-binding protein [Candidatus Saccharibacteria bacterium]|nr:sigma factor-like helix-turn-helix DNA-binding protein [Candidatus Saccharibacteria bacterium]